MPRRTNASITSALSQFRQDFPGVSAQHRRRAAVAGRGARKLHRRGDAAIALEFDEHPAMAGVRVLHHPPHHGDGSAGHAETDQPLGQLAAVVGRQVVLQGALQRLAVYRALAVVGEARVPRQFIGSQVLAQASELAIVADGEEDRLATGVVAVVGPDVRMGVAVTPGRTPGSEVVRQVRVQQGNTAVVKGDVHRLPAPADHVDDRQADAQRVAAGLAVHAHQSGAAG